MKTLLLASLFFASSLPAASASSAPRSLRYDIAKGNLIIGSLHVNVSKPYKGIRRIRIKADIDPLGSAKLGLDIKATSWVNKQWLPVKAKWDWLSFGSERGVRATYKNRRRSKRSKSKADGKWFKGPVAAKHMKFDRSHGINDLVSFGSWIVQQKLTPGKAIKTTAFTGNQAYDITAMVNPMAKLDIGGLKVDAYKLDVTAVRPGKTRKATMWIEAGRKNLSKIIMHADLVGDITMTLKSSGR
jgi:hypothetical protein